MCRRRHTRKPPAVTGTAPVQGEAGAEHHQPHDLAAKSQGGAHGTEAGSPASSSQHASAGSRLAGVHIPGLSRHSSSSQAAAPGAPPPPDGAAPARGSWTIMIQRGSSPGPSGSQQQQQLIEGQVLSSAQGSYVAAGTGTGLGSTPPASRAASIAPASSAQSMHRRPSSHSQPLSLLILPGIEYAPGGPAPAPQQLSSRALRQLARAQQQDEGMLGGMRVTLQRWDPAARTRSGARTRRNSSSSNTSAVLSARLLGLNLRTASQVSIRSVRTHAPSTSAAATSSELRPGRGTGGPGTGSEALLQESSHSHAQEAGLVCRHRPGSSSDTTQQAQSVQGNNSGTGRRQWCCSSGGVLLACSLSLRAWYWVVPLRHACRHELDS
jgi:hypothetical protein